MGLDALTRKEFSLDVRARFTPIVTPIIVPRFSGRAATKLHSFEGTSVGGRTISIWVETNAGVSGEMVLDDLHRSMRGVSDLRVVKNSSALMSPLAVMALCLFGWVVVLFAGVFLRMGLDLAGIVPWWDSNITMPEWVPFSSGIDIWVGAFRYWFFLTPAVAVGSWLWQIFACWKADREI